MDDMLEQLEAVIIRDRRRNPAPGSYTSRLFEAGRDKIAQKGWRRSGRGIDRRAASKP